MSASAWLAASVLAVAATLASCGGDESAPVTPTRAPPPAAATRAPETPSPSATPEVVSTPTPVPSPTAAPTPSVTPTPPPALTPAPEPGLVLGEPRDLPAGFALFYSVGPCYDCGFGLGDVRRAVFDKAAGVLREERLFTNLSAPGCPGLPLVSESGGELAVVVDENCTDPYARDEDPNRPYKPSLWVSQDGGDSWEDWGSLSPAVSVVEVAMEDIAVLEEGRLRWLRSGEGIPPPDYPELLEFRVWDKDGPVWAAPSGVYLNATGEEVAGPKRETFWLSFVDAAGNVRGFELRATGYVADELMPAAGNGVAFLIDLLAGSAHPIKGLPIPEEGARGSAQPGSPAYYFPFKVVPLAEPAAVLAIEYTELTMGEPRYQPPGYALFSLLRPCFWNCSAPRVGVVRTIRGERSGELHLDNPLASLEEFGSYFDFEVGSSGGLMAASVCLQGYCGGQGVPSDDAQQELWVSRDAGGSWESWGTVPAPTAILRVTEDDVAVIELPPSRLSELAPRVRWVRSGKDFPAPVSEYSAPRVVGWDGDVPIWDEWGARRHPPALSAVAPRTWSEVQTRPEGSVVWYATEVGEPLLLLAVVDARGAVEEVYGWPSADYVGRLVPMGEGLFAGFRMENGWGNGTHHMNFVIDLEARTVHPLPGLPDDGPWAEPWRAFALTAE